MVSNAKLPSGVFLATPTFTAMPSPTPTATRTRTPSPTPTQHLALRLVAPQDQERFEGLDAQVILSWEPAGTLAEDEWYGVSLRFTADGVVQYGGTWTKDTSWVVVSDFYTKADQAERAFQWDVTVMKQTGSQPDGSREGIALGPASETRTFLWY